MGLSFTDLQPGQFATTSIEGGLPKLVRIWEKLRKLNKGGYGSAVLVPLGDFTKASPEGVTSCSPFTCTALCMALDARPVDVGQPYALEAPYKPVFDGGRPVDRYFYALHNGFERPHYGPGKKWHADFKKNYVERVPQLENAFSLFNSAAGSVVALNLGKPVDPRQMRRGDVLGWDWNPKKVIVDGKEKEVVHGHAAFCWNVHLNSDGDVDCFQFVTSNGGYKGDVGISVCTYYGGKTYDPDYLEHSGGKYTPKKELFTGIIADPQGHPDYISRAVWFALPGVKARDIDKSSFGAVKNPVIFDGTGKFYVNHFVGATRLFGVEPPDPYLRADGKKGQNKPTEPAPVGKVVSKPVEKKSEPQKSEKKAEPAKVEKAEPGPPQDSQKDVEAALQVLWNARWIKSTPGDSSSVNDAESQAAIREYQQKFMNGKAPHLGHADAETRRRLLRAAGFAAAMPIVNVSLRMLQAQKVIATAPGDNPIQLDDATRASVKDFQQKKGLDPDGIPGQMTQAKLAEAIRGLEKAAQPPLAKGEQSGEAAAIQLFYWVTNNGAAGTHTTVKATATAACNGKSFQVGLFAGDKALVKDAGTLAIADGKGRLDVAIPLGLAQGTLLEARIEGNGVSAKTKSPFRIGDAGGGPIAVVKGADIYLDPPVRNLPQWDPGRWGPTRIAGAKTGAMIDWTNNGCNASTAAIILRWFAEDCKAGRIPFPTRSGGKVDKAWYGPRMGEAFWRQADPAGKVELTQAGRIHFRKIYGLASHYLKTAGDIERNANDQPVDNHPAHYVTSEPKNGWLELIKELLKTGPCIVGIGPPASTGHFVVAQAVIGGALLVVDPGNVLYQSAKGMGKPHISDWSNRAGFVDGTQDPEKVRMPPSSQWPSGKAPGQERDARGYNLVSGQFLKELLANLISVTSLTHPEGAKLGGGSAPQATPKDDKPQPEKKAEPDKPKPGPASKGKVKSGAITVAGKPFAEWFNKDFHPKHTGKHPTIKVKGNYLAEFPHSVSPDNFRSFFDATKQLSGEDEISLLKFAAAFCIPYNETGGSFHPTLEKGGKVWLPRGQKTDDKRNLIDFGEYGYFFWGIPGYKASYNKRDGSWTWPAGDQLQKMGLLDDKKQIEIWNGRPMWELGDPLNDKNYPKPLEDPRYPNPQSEPLRSAQNECHFYKFRGRGFTQTTGREGYTKYADAALVAAGYKKVDELKNDELDKAFADPKVYVGVFHNELISPPGPHKQDFAKIDDDPGKLVTIGDRIAGVGANYGEFYAWRCKTLAAAMEEAGWTGG
jgi:putative peptidoglycan binding protein